MSQDRFLTAQFCDDIRQEVGYKFSLMGCYSAELIIDDYPTALPKLCALVTARTPIERPFLKLLLRARLGDETVAELQVPDNMLSEQKKAAASSMSHGAKFITVSAMMVFSPLVIQEEADLRIEAESEEGMVNSPALTIRQRRETDPPVFPQNAATAG